MRCAAHACPVLKAEEIRRALPALSCRIKGSVTARRSAPELVCRLHCLARLSPQCFQQKCLLVCPCNIVIDIVAGHCVEALVGEIQLHGVSAPERSVFHARRSGFFFAQRQTEGGIFLALAVNADHFPLRIALCAGNGQRTAAAADIQSHAALR